MKKMIALVLISVASFSQGAIACDEDCMREKAQAEHKVNFAGFLSWKYCEGIAMDFMTSTMRSLDSYRTKNFGTRYKGPLKNTRNYLSQRKDWLAECDQYMKLTKEIRVFYDDKTTQRIFASIDSVTGEFDALIDGASYSSEDEAKAVFDNKVDGLFQLVDDHKTMMHLKGKYVFR